MKLIDTAQLDLEATDANPRTGAPMGRVMLDGRATDTRVAGAIREAGVGLDAGFLLITSDDVPFEEAVHLHLLDAAAQPIESATIGAPYTAGIFGDLVLEPPDQLHFAFIGPQRWHVRILRSAHLHLPLLGDPHGVWRGLRLRTRLRIRTTPAA